MRAAAEVEPVALEIDLDRLVAGNGVDQLDLEGLALVAEHLLGLLAVPDFLGEGFVARDDLAHLLLDRGKIFRRERLVAEEVVVEAVLDHRADGDLRARPQRLHRFGQHMRGSHAGSVPARAASSRAMSSIFASLEIGSLRSATTPSSAIATVRLASEGEMPLAISSPVMSLGNSRLAPSGKVRAIFLHGFGRFQIREAELESGCGRIAGQALSSPEAHSCERAQVSGKQRYSRRFGRRNRAFPEENRRFDGTRRRLFRQFAAAGLLSTGLDSPPALLAVCRFAHSRFGSP